MKKLIITLAVAALAGGLAVPAHAAGVTVSVTPNQDVARTATSVGVTLSGIPAGQGVYVMYCAKSLTANVRSSSCYGTGIWASTDTNMLAQGAVATTGNLNLPVALTFTPKGGSLVNCETAGCGVFVRRDHMGPTDYSLDTFVPVSFVPLVAPKVNAVAEKGRVLVTVAGFKGQTLNIAFGMRNLTKAIATDSAKFYIGNSAAKNVNLVVTAGAVNALTQKIELVK